MRVDYGSPEVASYSKPEALIRREYPPLLISFTGHISAADVEVCVKFDILVDNGVLVPGEWPKTTYSQTKDCVTRVVILKMVKSQ